MNQRNYQMKPKEMELDYKDKKILTLVARGHAYKEITKHVSLSESRIKARIHIMKEYFGVTSTPALIAHYISTKALI